MQEREPRGPKPVFSCSRAIHHTVAYGAAVRRAVNTVPYGDAALVSRDRRAGCKDPTRPARPPRKS